MLARRIQLLGKLILGVGVIALAGLIGFLVFLNSTLPTVAELEDPEYSLPTTIYDRNGIKVQEMFIKRRKLVTYEQIPAHMINSLIAKEDARFFEHHGIDPLRMLKAAWVNLIALRTVQGASTLTQQTARQFFLTLEKTWIRKLSEILLALSIERQFTKEEIITLYLNQVNFGDAYGVEAAAEYYFDKTVEDLSLAEGALLVGLLPAPNRYKPTRSLRLARQQRDIVLQRAAEEGFISAAQQLAAASEPILLAERAQPEEEAAAYYVELVRRELLKRYGSHDLYEGGLHVTIAMDLSHQIAAHQALVEGLRAIDRRGGYRGPLENIELDEFGRVPSEFLEDLRTLGSIRLGRVTKGVVVAVEEDEARVNLGTGFGTISWERLQEQWKQRINPDNPNDVRRIDSLADVLTMGDVIQVWVENRGLYNSAYQLDLYQEPQANGAVYAIKPNTGEVLAMVGGIRFGRGQGASEFIRATQAERQPGSAFKPIIYAAAIDEGFTPATMLDDSPRVFILASGAKHIPRNYDNRYLGRTSLREALYRSRNAPTVQLVEELGPEKVIGYARRLGFTTPIPQENIISLGTHSVRLDELTHAYGTFANGGRLAQPQFILRVEDAKGNLLDEAELASEQVISEATAFLVTDLLRDVVRVPGGTAYRAMNGLARPAAGKTGTTQNYTDAWYLGYIPQLAAGVYVGYDDPSVSLGPAETGSRSAAPIWRQYLDAVQGALPIAAFEQPPSVVAHRVDTAGHLMGPCEDDEGGHYEFFKQASIPPRLLFEADCFVPPVSNNDSQTVYREDTEL